MKKVILSTTLLLGSYITFSQLSSEISSEQFRLLQEDHQIDLKWNAIVSLTDKKEVRSEDAYAVYTAYLEALKASSLREEKTTASLLEKEITATEEKIKNIKK